MHFATEASQCDARSSPRMHRHGPVSDKLGTCRSPFSSGRSRQTLGTGNAPLVSRSETPCIPAGFRPNDRSRWRTYRLPRTRLEIQIDRRRSERHICSLWASHMNNNNAEHAVKAFASVRRVIEGPTTEKGLRDFLVLLSICETCKCKNVDFLDFLRSGTKDIDDFAANGRKRRVRGANQR